MRPASSANTRYASRRSASRSAPLVVSPRSTPTRTSRPGPMVAMGVPETVTLPHLDTLQKPNHGNKSHIEPMNYQSCGINAVIHAGHFIVTFSGILHSR